MHTHTHHFKHSQVSSRRSTGSTSSTHENGTVESQSPTVPAPIRPSAIPIELPQGLTQRMDLSDFTFLKVLGKGSFGKVWK